MSSDYGVEYAAIVDGLGRGDVDVLWETALGSKRRAELPGRLQAKFDALEALRARIGLDSAARRRPTTTAGRRKSG